MNKKISPFNSCLFVFCLLLSWGCGSGGKKGGEGLYIVCTTGMIADAVENIAGDKAVVDALMGPGVDPHLYKATQGDLKKLMEADIIFYNGLHLEGKMGEILENFGKQKKVIAVSDGIDPNRIRMAQGFKDSKDPHIWFDVSLWSEAVKFIFSELVKLDLGNAEFYTKNFMKYDEELKNLHEFVKNEVVSIPKENRVLITAHDAFGYFGNAYGIEVEGLQGISTMSEYGLKDITEMVTDITERKIKAVFVESSVPRKSLEAVVLGCREKGHEVKIGGTLFSDAMGRKGSPEGTYTGMVKYNVSTIVNALK